MVVFINPFAGGGTAVKKWNAEGPRILSGVDSVDVIETRSPEHLHDEFTQSLEHGERHFVAAGGDGSVSALLQLIVKHAPENPDLVLGAIGLGSSNDFHKPFRHRSRIPAKLDFQHALLRDVGILDYRTRSGQVERRYWLLNASAGITAEANAFFNLEAGNSRFLATLKRHHTTLAIMYAAFHTLAKYQNRSIEIVEGASRSLSKVTNLGIVKSPHFAGDFCYDTPLDLDSGCFYVHVAEGLSKRKVLRLMIDLAKGTFSGKSGRRSECATLIELKGTSPFAIEYDGEVIRTTTACFSLLPAYLKVCS